MKIDWKRKLTSRKFWLAITSFVSMIIIALGGTEGQASQSVSLIMAGASVIAYIIGEGLADASNAGSGSDSFYSEEDDDSILFNDPDPSIDDGK